NRSAPEDRFSRQGAGRIWVKQLNGGGEVAVTSGPLDSNPRFSPDGTTLLFLRSEGRKVNLLRIPILGGDARTIRSDVVSADWSPAGDRIVFTSFGEVDGRDTSTIRTISSNGTGEKVLATIEDRVIRTIRWSPDGSRLVGVEAATSGTTDSQLVFIDAEDGSIDPFDHPLARAFMMFPAWTPDGNLIWSNLESVYSQSTSVVMHDFEENETRTLFWSLEGAGVIDVLPPNRIVMSSSDQRQNLRRTTFGPGGEPSASEWLTRGSGIDRQPVYSPDGKWIMFSSTRSGNLDLWQLSTESGEVSRVTDDVANDWDPGFTPDGESILWSSDRSGNYEIWMARRDGSGARQVTRDEIDAENPTMTPDGSWITYASAGSDKRGIWKIRPDGTHATRIAEGTYILPEISPDGRWVSFVEAGQVATHSTIHVIGIDGEDASFRIEVDSPVPATNLGRHRWLPDGSAIAFWSSDESGNLGFFAQDFEPGSDTSSTRRKYAGFDSEVQAESFGIAPDGSEVTISANDYEFAIVMADGVDLR
ncbi:MAG: DPP IV N-terminal domain-containing protein, partial [Thermoanaerobaculia bacterium]|nr:DPP IV N-terminal domain-containing protein [Thermoanaerobaculia bacterium]